MEANRTAVIDVKLDLGSETASVQVSANAEILTRDGPLRGGNFTPSQITQLPLSDPNPLSLAGTLPGVIRPSGTTAAEGGGAGVQFSVNGQRVRGNNFLIDGTDNNDIGFTGVTQPFNMVDAIEEISVQTSNFSAEFGRAAGGILNVVTKSGTNAFHGTGLWRYQSERFDSIDNLSRLEGTPQSVFVHNIDGFTIGGPMVRNRTFFFAGFQNDSNRSTTNFPLVVPTAAAVERLVGLFPLNPRLMLYLNSLGTLRGTGAPFSEALGPDPQSGIDRGSVQFATAPYPLPSTDGGPQWLARIDHYTSEKHRFSARYTYDSSLTSPGQRLLSRIHYRHGRAQSKCSFQRHVYVRPGLHERVPLLLRAAGCRSVEDLGAVGRAGADTAEDRHQECRGSGRAVGFAISRCAEFPVSGHGRRGLLGDTRFDTASSSCGSSPRRSRPGFRRARSNSTTRRAILLSLISLRISADSRDESG